MNATNAMRGLSQLHERDGLVAFARTWSGKIVLFAAVAVLLHPFPHTELVLPALAAVTLLPEKRRLILSLAGLAVLADLLVRRARGTPGGRDLTAAELWQPLVVTAALLVAVSVLTFLAARHFARLPGTVRRHPLLFLHLSFWSLLGGVWVSAPPRLSPGLLVLGLLPFFLWRASYLLLSAQRGKVESTRLRDHFFVLWPAFGGTDVPFGKGLDHLARHEAKDGRTLARAQLAGVKLLVLACLWEVVSRAMSGVVYADRETALVRLLGGFTLNVPHLEELLRNDVAAPVAMAWLAVFLELVRVTLSLAVIGHVIIGSLRLFGFNVFRNTYKPLLAESIVDFWNRFYYYFKELLVELWFYPTYLSVSRKRPRLRLFAATFAAAFAGNLYYHVLRDRQLLAAADLETLWSLHAPRAVYCFLLASGIFVSMLRQQGRRGAPDSPRDRAPLLGRRAWRIAGVWTFFALIHVFSVSVPGVGVAQRFGFFLFLAGFGHPSDSALVAG